MAKNRLTGLDTLRGLAALSVVLFHFTFSYAAEHPRFGPSFSVPYGKYGVDLFFMISGFVIFMTLERVAGAREFLLSRFARLYPAFWMALLMAAIWSPLNGGPIVGLRTMLANATMVPVLFGAPGVDGVYWSLNCEILFYVLAAAFLLSGSRKPEFACLGWLVASILVLYHSELSLLINAPYAYMFIIGVMIYRLRQNPKNIAAWGTLATAIFVGSRMPYPPDLHVSGLPNAAIAAGLAGILWLGMTIKPPRPLVYLGELSYSLYLIHTPLGFAVLNAGVKFGLRPDLSIAIAILAVVALASVLNAWVERPAQRWIKDRYARAVSDGPDAGCRDTRQPAASGSGRVRAL